MPLEVQDNIPVLSVLLPVYNAAVFLEQAIDSILQQTYCDFELIVIDDASTDGSDTVLDKISDPRIVRIKFNQNKGIVAALNKALDISRGRFIARMDADDIAAPNRFQLQVQYLEGHPEVAVVGSWIRGFGRVRRPYVLRYPVSHASIEAGLLFDSPFAHPAVMMRRAMLDALEKKYSVDFPYTEDWELWSRLVRVGRAANIPVVLLDYRIHVKSSSRQFTDLQSESKTRLLQRIYSDFELTFSQKFLLDDPTPNRGWLIDCHEYFFSIIIEARKSGILNMHEFCCTVQDQFLKRISGMTWFGFYPAWFAFRHSLNPALLPFRLIAASKIFFITNARAFKCLIRNIA